MARVEDGNETQHLNSTNYPSAQFAKENNNVAVSNGSLSLFKSDFSQLFALEPALKPSAVRIDQIVKDGNYSLSNFAELYVLLSNDLMEALYKDNSIKIVDENTVRVVSNVTELRFAPMREDGVYFIGAKVHFISDKMPELNEFAIDLKFQMEGENPEVLRFTAIRDESVYFKAQAEASSTKVVRAKEDVILTSNLIFDDAKYTWYNEAGEKIGEGSQITEQPLSTQKYTIEIVKDEDGFKSYDAVEVAVVDGKITSVAPNPAQDNLHVEYKLSDYTASASIHLSDTQNSVSASYPISTTNNYLDISLSGFVPGTYFVKLAIGNVIVDTKTIIKK